MALVDDRVPILPILPSSLPRKINGDPFAGLLCRRFLPYGLERSLFHAVPGLTGFGSDARSNGRLLLGIQCVIENMRVRVDNSGNYRSTLCINELCLRPFKREHL